MHPRAAALVLMMAASAAGATDAGPPAPDNPNWFPFPIHVFDSSPTAIDLSFLNDRPAGGTGFLRAEGEHVVDGAGRQVRLFGTNFCGGACCPEEADAVKVAAHLAKNGINVVRLHHMDNDWGESLIQDNATTTLHAGNLAKLDRLVAELIRQGIYINLNLHVSRTYPGTPEGAPRYSKGLDHFHPPFIEAFKTYARKLLSRVNPHTGRAYKDEPGIAVIEMNNENSLVLNPWWMSKLEEPFAGGLRALFVKHLRARYPDTGKLREAWGLNDGSTGPDLIKNGSFTEGTKGWFGEANFGAKATLTMIDGGGIRWTSTHGGAEAWSLQFSQAGLDLDENKAYRLSFRARSDRKASLEVHAQNAGEPWARLGMQETMELTPEWQTFSFEFAPHSVLPGGRNRIVFSLLNQVTSVDIADVRLVSISTGHLKPDQTLEAGSIPIPGRNAKLAVRRDFLKFLAQLEIDHALAMKKFIREEIGAQQMITHSHVLFGGIVGARREFLVSDMVDTHGYWHHPHFPRKFWDMNDWAINNVSQVEDEDGGTLAEMAMQRPANKPYSVSEYDTPAPNDFAAETFPLLAAMACLQDWSAIYHFNFKHRPKYDSDRITGFFDLPGHPAKQAFMPLAALMFRRQLIAPMHRTHRLALAEADIHELAARKSGDLWGSWRDAWAELRATGALAWQTGVCLDLMKNESEPPFQIVPLAGASPGRRQPSTPPVTATAKKFPAVSSVVPSGSQKARSNLAFGGNCILMAGKLDRFEQAAAGRRIVINPDAANPPGVLLLVPLDGLDLFASRKLWLCALSRAENPNMGWDKDRRTVGHQWGTGPALVLGLKATIMLPGDAAWNVTALDPTGAPQAVIAEKTREFAIDPSQKTVWWLISGDPPK